MFPNPNIRVTKRVKSRFQKISPFLDRTRGQVRQVLHAVFAVLLQNMQYFAIFTVFFVCILID